VPDCGKVWAIAEAMAGEAGTEPADLAHDQESPSNGVQGVLFANGPG
jgi:hypothetical protein